MKPALRVEAASGGFGRTGQGSSAAHATLSQRRFRRGPVASHRCFTRAGKRIAAGMHGAGCKMEVGMARDNGTATAVAPSRRGIPLVPTLVLSLWRLRQTWRLLLVSGMGVLAAVVLICAVPLFSQVALSAGLRDALSQFPSGSDVRVIGETNTPEP